MNKSLKLFEEKSEEFQDAFEGFNKFYEQFEEFFFAKDFSEQELELVKKLKQQIDILEKGKIIRGQQHYINWDGDDLTRAEFKIASYLLPLGEIASQKVQRSNAMNRWVKWRKFNEWSPVKSFLEKKLIEETESLEKKGRVYKEEIENLVGKKIFAESMLESFLQGHADQLMNLFDSTRSILTALAHRINLKKDERSLDRKTK
jgi:hypothetical protein